MAIGGEALQAGPLSDGADRSSAAVTLRIIIPVGLATGVDFPTAYLIAAWAVSA